MAKSFTFTGKCAVASSHINSSAAVKALDYTIMNAISSLSIHSVLENYMHNGMCIYIYSIYTKLYININYIHGTLLVMLFPQPLRKQPSRALQEGCFTNGWETVWVAPWLPIGNMKKITPGPSSSVPSKPLDNVSNTGLVGGLNPSEKYESQLGLLLPQSSLSYQWLYITGWWYTYPSEKYESQSGWWLFPIYGKIKHVWNHQPGYTCHKHFIDNRQRIIKASYTKYDISVT